MKNRAHTDINSTDWERYSATFLNDRVRVLTGDITRQDVNAIVNAANASLLGGGGVDGAIHRAGGEKILEECREIRRTQFPDGLPTGEAVMTGGGLLVASHVIHTVGPIYGRNAGQEAQLLADCYRNSLALAVEHELESVAFPSISTGAFGYPKSEAAVISSTAIATILKANDFVKEVRLVFYSQPDMDTFLKNHRLDDG